MTSLGTGRQIAINNILFATDFSLHSNAALPYALGIAHQFGAKLFGAHVLSSDDFLYPAPEAWPAQLQQEQRLGEEVVARLEEQLRGVPHQALSGVGNVWTVVQRLVREHDIDLIVVGSHGRTGARKLLMGSVAEKIFRQASCPVLTVGPKVAEQDNSVAELNRVLLATDFGKASSAAASYAVSLAREHQARLSLLHVLEPSRPGALSPEPASDLLFRRLQELVPPDAQLLSPPDYFIQFGLPADRILQFSCAHEIDLIVIGVHSPEAVSAVTHLAHSTAQHIVAHAACPVLTVRG
jgi:nucleotide-binding universal stress UspA family protein